ncbi:RhoGAP domain containing protein [Histomonas meleagridis]|uniref:RhoGAP domain containing protein n=1 Tax=Histomonas meleagridis TaxID=135588 RepID=UPI00355A5A9A|nr:RhoGAP domain containing protein [Histomonas meleagridis]KAH0796497.1 RhoGAP domain containing protein [Histomonas meleagridis]
MFSFLSSFFDKEEVKENENTKEEPTAYGTDIHALPVNDNAIPVFLTLICNEIIKQANVVGLFRVCGDHMIVQELGKAALSYYFWVPQCSVHDLTSMLKQWLRMLPTPILTPSVVNKCYKNDKESCLEILRELDPLNRKCIATILATIQIVIDQSETNQMTFSNISICFVPSFLQNGKDIEVTFDFQLFFDTCIEYMNADGNDIDIKRLYPPRESKLIKFS